MSINTAGKLYLFNFNGLLLFLCFLFPLVTLVAVLSVVHCAAYGRVALRCDEHEIKTFVISIFFCTVYAP